METVTSLVKEFKQPRGGFLNPKTFVEIQREDDKELKEENISPASIGLCVDYLTRYLITHDKEASFEASLLGAKNADRFIKNSFDRANKLLESINTLDSKSIISACKLVSFDTWYRNPQGALSYASNIDLISPDENTIQNVKIMVERSLSFLKEYGPVKKFNFDFLPEGGDLEELKLNTILCKENYGGYTPTVCQGEGDFLTQDTLFDFKVSKHKLDSKQTLQLLLYWIMGKHSGQEIYNNIQRLGVYNPRLNVVYLTHIKLISEELIHYLEKEVIRY